MEIETVRAGQKVWPTCPKCGCRLEILDNGKVINLRHFWGGLTKDARGCVCMALNLEWAIIKKEISHLGYC